MLLERFPTLTNFYDFNQGYMYIMLVVTVIVS